MVFTNNAFTCYDAIKALIASSGPQERAEIMVECRTQCTDFSVENVDAALENLVAGHEIQIDNDAYEFTEPPLTDAQALALAEYRVRSIEREIAGWEAEYEEEGVIPFYSGRTVQALEGYQAEVARLTAKIEAATSEVAQ